MSETKVITGKVRFSYAHVFKPQAANEDGEPKYSVSILIPKTDKTTIEKVKNGIKAALKNDIQIFSEKNQKTIEAGKIPSGGFRNPLRDGDEEREDSPEYENMYFINASSKRKPGLVDKDREDIISEDDFYSGCYGRASFNFYGFNKKGNQGVACGLNNLQKLEDGERLGGGGASAQEDFDDDFETEEDAW